MSGGDFVLVFQSKRVTLLFPLWGTEMKLTIVIPHKSTPLTDEALRLCLKILRENSCEPQRFNEQYEVVIPQGGEVYQMYNDGGRQARADNLLYLNNDMFMGPGWDKHMFDHLDDNALVTGYVVEPGVIKVALQNILKDFGRTADTYRREKFDNFARYRQAKTPTVRNFRGWYMPLFLTKGLIDRLGGYPTDNSPYAPNDVRYFRHCAEAGVHVRQVNFYCYHLQGLSEAAHDPKRRTTLTSRMRNIGAHIKREVKRLRSTHSV